MMFLDLSSSEHREERDIKEQVELQAGERLEVALYDIPSTGFLWRISSFPEDCIKSVEDRGWVSELSEGGDLEAAGDGGKQIFAFAAAESGQGEIVIQRLRPWEPENLAATVRIKVSLN